MELKTAEYYAEMARKMKFSTKALIDGKFVDSKSGERIISVNPATNEQLIDITCCDERDAATAQQAAREAFEDGRWSALAPAERKSILIRLADLIEEHGEELAVIESLDSGKPIYDNITGDVPETAETFRWHAEAADKLEGQITAGDGEHLSMVVREPVGVVGAIVPWNFPMLMAAWKIAPILASGNSCIVKPAQLTSLSLLKIAELAMEAGVPEGVLNVLPGKGSVVGNAIAMHPQIEAITFTGSTEVGKRLLVQSGKTNAKSVFLEMGGKNPCIIMPDVKDLDAAADEAVNAVFWNMGENCTSNSRLLVHESIHDVFVEKVLERTKKLKTGNPLSPDSNLGALVETPHANTVLEYIEKGKKEGAELLLGGEHIGKSVEMNSPNEFAKEAGNFISPAVFDNVSLDMEVSRHEIFGPVLCISSFSDESQAIAMANDTEYGLQASLFTDDLSTAHRMAGKLRAGTVSVNCYSEGDIGTPFGGFKQSGFLSRDNSLWANRQYTELKTIWIKI